VVRFGGKNTDWELKAKEQAAEAAADLDVGRPELSTWCAIPLDDSPEEFEASVELACQEAGLGYTTIRVATGSEIRLAGLDLDWREDQGGGSACHWNIPLASVEEADTAVAAFGDTKKNPRPRRRGR
jgi:hypothetical protein